MNTDVQNMPWYPRWLRFTHLVLLSALCSVNIWMALTHEPRILFFRSSDTPEVSALMASLTILVTYNFLGFLAGCLLAMIPIRRIEYGQRYVRICFACMILTQALILLYGVALQKGWMEPLVQGM